MQDNCVLSMGCLYCRVSRRNFTSSFSQTPYVNLSIHTAPANHHHKPLDSIATKILKVPLVSDWPRFSLGWHIPFALPPLQELHHYYGMIRPSYMHRYFPPSCFALIRFSLGIMHEVPTFHRKAQIKLVPPIHRMPPKSVSRWLLGLSQDSTETLILTSFSLFTALTVVHLSLTFLIHTCRILFRLFPNAHDQDFWPQPLRVVW